MTVDINQLKNTLSQFPTGVCVITTKDKVGHNFGITVNSFNSVSLNPPLVLWSINKDTHSTEVFTETSHFNVNILAEQQIAISNQFASNIDNRFQDINYQLDANSIPLLEDLAAYLQCKTWQIYEGGDHLIIVGEVINTFVDNDKQSLLYYRGNYATTKPCC